MKTKIIIAAGLALNLVMAPGVWANSIVLNQNAYSYADAGEFTAHTSPQNFLGSYVSSTIVNGGFETFCVEESVFFSPNTSYTYTLNNSDSQGRVLTLGTAFLYYEFARGILSGYDYNNTSARKADAGELQAAIWKLQGNQSGGASFPNGGSGNSFYDLAVSTLGLSNISAANNGTYGVQILQLWDRSGGTHQNQLVVTSVPDRASTLLLLAMGLISLFVLQSRIPRLQAVRNR